MTSFARRAGRALDLRGGHGDESRENADFLLPLRERLVVSCQILQVEFDGFFRVARRLLNRDFRFACPRWHLYTPDASPPGEIFSSRPSDPGRASWVLLRCLSAESQADAPG